MRTLRNITFIAALLFSGTIFAQNSTDQKAQIEKQATEKTTAMDAAIGLNADQKLEVEKIFNGALRQEMALTKRFTSTDMEVDQEYIDKNIQATLAREFQKVLTPEQYNAWKLSEKK